MGKAAGAGAYCLGMRRSLPAPNLTALLAVAALADLVFYRIIDAIFMPGHDGTGGQRWMGMFALFVSNLAGVLALFVGVLALFQALRSEQVFPRAMRITVTTIGLFAFVLAGLGLVWLPAATRFHVHLRISHGFLVFFLALGAWHRERPLRLKLGVTLFAMPIVLQAAALFLHQMAWTSVDPVRLVRAAHVIALAAMITAPVLLAPWPTSDGHAATVRAAVGGLLAATALGCLFVLRFDLAQAIFFYGLHVDLTGLASTPEKIYIGAIVLSISCLAAAVAAGLFAGKQSRLVAWGLVLIGVAGTEIASPKSALFTLCGLFALTLASAKVADSVPAAPAQI
jgi:hypothetical protein